MASGSPSSPASGSPSSPASGSDSSSSSSNTHASDDSYASDSSTTSLPSTFAMLASVHDVRRALRAVDPDVHIKYILEPHTPLFEAHELCKLVNAVNGEGELINPDRLSNKEEAFRCVQSRLERLRRWKSHLEDKQVGVLHELAKVDEAINSGGPGARSGYEPHRYTGPPAYIDTEQVIEEEELRDHIEAIRSLLLQGSPGSPADDGGCGSAEDCLDRECKEQMAVALFNQEYLQLKASALELLIPHLASGIQKLEDRFLKKPTFLGAGDAEFIRFLDFPMFAAEMPPPEGSSDFFC